MVKEIDIESIVNDKVIPVFGEIMEDLGTETKIRPDIGPGKYYLDRITGSYDSSLYSLIHHVLNEFKIYEMFLNERQLKDVQKVINRDVNWIYHPDIDECEDFQMEEEYQAEEHLEIIQNRVIEFVGKTLKENGCDIDHSKK